MKAMILAAGLGTRLRPLTDTTPKALLEVDGIPLLELVIQRVQRYGFHDIIINVHHFAKQIIEFLEKKSNFGLNICLSHEQNMRLDTGGGLKNAAWFFDDHAPFLLHNVDIISDLNLQEMYYRHTCTRALATLAVTDRESTRCLLFDRERTLCGWKNKKTGEVKISRTSDTDLIPLAFSGIHIINPEIFDMMPEKNVFSILDVYLQVAATENIIAFHHDHTLWADLGKKEHLSRASKILREIRRKDQYESY